MSKNGLTFTGKAGRSVTQQHFRDQVNINNIVAKAKRTGVLPKGLKAPYFADISNVPQDYHACLQQIKKTEQLFMALPSKLRKRFENDPQKLVDFCSNDENYVEAMKLGLLPELTNKELVAKGLMTEDEKSYKKPTDPEPKPLESEGEGTQHIYIT